MPIFMKFGPINGNVTAQGYQGWIEIESFSWGVANQPTTPGTAGKVSVGDITITKSTDVSSPGLVKELLAGTSTDGVTISFFKAIPNQAPYLQYTLGNTLVSSYSLSLGAALSNAATTEPTANVGQPYESITLNFTKIEFNFTGQTVGYDESTGTVISPGLPLA